MWGGERGLGKADWHEVVWEGMLRVGCVCGCRSAIKLGAAGGASVAEALRLLTGLKDIGLE